METDEEREREEALGRAASEAVTGLVGLYRAYDGDEAQVGETLYELEKSARRSWRDEPEHPADVARLRAHAEEMFGPIKLVDWAILYDAAIIVYEYRASELIRRWSVSVGEDRRIVSGIITIG